MAIYADISADQGSNFSSVVSVVDTDNSPIDLTNYTARGQIRKTYTSTNFNYFSCVIGSPATNGEINISLAASTTSAMKAGRYVYDIEIESEHGVITRVIEGQFILTPSVTRNGV